ncbi:MAG TPA: hypothetical protein VJN88_10190 [Ktedonobacterales bacterium]|nr:hypothetical protein [Ktedonobacterales bacterium]
MANLDAPTVEALNMLLEDERASVEMEIAFANGATERPERETFVEMGGAEVLACCALRERLSGAGNEVSRQINGIVLRILSVERYDERLRAFAEHQLAVCAAIQRLLDTDLESETRRLLDDIYQRHARYGRWCELRAEEFAQSRLLDFRTTRPETAALPGDVSDVASQDAASPPGDQIPLPQDAQELMYDIGEGGKSAPNSARRDNLAALDTPPDSDVE